MRSLIQSLVWLFLLFGQIPSLRAEASAPWLQVPIGVVGVASEEILNGALAEVEEGRMQGLIIVLDTPGGLLESTRKMVQKILNAPFPIVVWVGPSGAHAGSAGAFITMAGHVAAMAPGSNIGAAHPIGLGQAPQEKNELDRKVENDAVALMESIAELRQRNVEIAASFVKTSLSLSAEEALRQKAIDLIAPNTEILMRELHGKEVRVGDRVVSLQTQGVPLKEFQISLRNQVLQVLSNPDLFYMLLIIGLVGIGFELTHPGTIAPGVVGTISLILAFVASSVLPVNFGALALLVAGIGFMIAELFLPSFGILGVGGFIGFIFGSLLLVDPHNIEGLRISWLTILPAVTLIAALMLAIFYLLIRAERSPKQSGAEAMVGEIATVSRAFSGGKGRVKVWGEDWQAKTSSTFSLEKGAEVRIIAVDGLTLMVEPMGVND